MKNALKGWTLFEKIWIIVFSMINFYLFFILNDGFISLVISLCGMVGVILAAKGLIYNYYFGIVKVTLYGYVAFTHGLYSEAMLNLLFYLPAQIIGLYLWNKHSNNDVVEVKSLNKKQFSLLIILTIFLIIIYSLILNMLNINSTGFDAFVLILSIVGQILMINRYKEQWLYWISVNIFAIIMWIIALNHSSGDYNILVMWIALLISSIYGYMNWLKLNKNQ